MQRVTTILDSAEALGSEVQGRSGRGQSRPGELSEEPWMPSEECWTLLFFFFFFISSQFLGQLMRHMEFPRLGVELEL